MKMALKTLLFFSVVIGFSGCHIDKSKPNFELIQDMMESPAIKSQEFDEDSPNHAGMRVPPEGTQPRGFEPYPFPTNPEASKTLKNPFEKSFSEETLKTGIKYYTIHCSICHGVKGEGGEKMTVAETMALKPPSLLSDKIKGWSDGQIYHVITMGQGVMGPYASHIPQKYRWQVVQYIRHLERGQ
jgi:hypothetical protein